jgi:hypothetical protein
MSFFSDLTIPGCFKFILFVGLRKQSKTDGVCSIDVSVLGCFEELSYFDFGKQNAKSFRFNGTLIVSIRLFWLEYDVSTEDLGAL